MIDAETRRIFLLDEGIQIERHVRIIDKSFVFTDAKGREISKKKRIDEKLINYVISELVGEEATPIVSYLRGKKQISEFIIAEELDLEIHLTRNLLYRLLEFNIVSFLRKKDRIKGWYICYWDFNEGMIPYLGEKLRLAKIARLKERLEKESNNTFYLCKSACTRMTFEKSMEFNFKCPECGEVMQEQDNSRTKEFLKQQIKLHEKKELV
jgi:transcription initiation factor TFIIE subunit alpha